MWSVAADGLGASAQCRAQTVAARSSWLRQPTVRCVADWLLAVLLLDVPAINYSLMCRSWLFLFDAFCERER